MKKTSNGFTLIELLVVIAIIGILSSIVLASLSGARANARDSQRRQALNQIRTALELYYLDNGEYPKTGSFTFNVENYDESVYGDSTCVFSHASDQAPESEWVPGLVSGGYISSLPKDPVGDDQARGRTSNGACYMYSSNGIDYILSAWATVENGPIGTNDPLYSRAGFREPNHNSLSDAGYLCDHGAIGDSGDGDYYRYSYTLTTVDCDW